MGYSSAAMLSVKANRSLRKGRNSLFDRDVKRKERSGEEGHRVPPASLAVREKFSTRLAEERVRERRILLFSIVLGIVLFAAAAHSLWG